MRPPALTGRNLLHFDDLNAMSSGTMTSGHVSIALRYGSTHSDVSIFTIHIVGSTTRVVTQPDCDVLDLRRPAFEDLFTAYDFSSCLFDLLEFSYEKPKPALGYYIVRCEYPHLHQWRGLDFLCWPSATDNLELLQLAECSHIHVVLSALAYSVLRLPDRCIRRRRHRWRYERLKVVQ